MSLLLFSVKIGEIMILTKYDMISATSSKFRLFVDSQLP